MALPAGFLASLMTGAPIALPKLACGVCAAARALADPTCPPDPIASATTLYGGTLVCDAHAASEHQRAERADRAHQRRAELADELEADRAAANLARIMRPATAAEIAGDAAERARNAARVAGSSSS